MKFKLALFSIAAVAVVAAPSADAALIAYWNFNSLSIAAASLPGVGGVPTTIAADSGTGSLDLTGFLGTVDDFAGATGNALNGDPAEESLSLISSTGNGSYIAFSFSTIGIADAIVLTADVRGTASGYTTGAWSYSLNGTDYLAITGKNISTTSTTFSVLTANFADVPEINNQATVTLRYTVSGATTTTGNNRLDNVQINAVPEPSAALLGLVGFVGVLRRRR